VPEAFVVFNRIIQYSGLVASKNMINSPRTAHLYALQSYKQEQSQDYARQSFLQHHPSISHNIKELLSLAECPRGVVSLELSFVADIFPNVKPSELNDVTYG
jgi:hypothetical protein